MTFWLFEFARCGPARYLSHLDTARAVQRTFARAAVPIALSQGLRPKPRLSLPLPLPVGAAGRAELAVVEVRGDGPGEAAALRALRAAASPGLEPTGIVVAGDRHPRPQARAAEYACLVDGDAGALVAAVERYASEVHVAYERVSPKGRRVLDLKKYVADAVADRSPGGALLRFTVQYRDDGAARPQEFIGLVASWAGAEPVMRRLERTRITWEGLPAGLSRAGGRSPS